MATGIALGGLVLLFALLVWRIVRVEPGAMFVDKIAEGEKPLAPATEADLHYRRADTWTWPQRAALEDGKVGIHELQGIPVVVNFFASYCVPCKDELPALARLAHEYRGRVAFLGVDTEDFRSDGTRLLERFNVPYPSIFDGRGTSRGKWGLTGIPETYVVDARGRATIHLVGRASEEEFRKAIDEVIASP